MNPYDLMNVALVVKKMRDTAEQWHNEGYEKRQELHSINQSLAETLRTKYGIPTVYETTSGTWHVGSADGPLLFDLY